MYFDKIINKKDIEPLFQSTTQTIIQAYFEGNIGFAYADNLLRPTTVVINTGCFFFLAGKPNPDMLYYIPKVYSDNYAILVPIDDIWQNLIENVYRNNYEKITRYSFYTPKVFDIHKLQLIISKLPKNYQLKAIEEKDYQQIINLEWAKDLCKNFSSYLDFEKSGLGFIILKDNVIVSGASSYLAYNNSIDIEVDTIVEERRKGLALISSAKLILACLNRQISPNWDAHNKPSLKLAIELGFLLNQPYSAYIVWNL